jgi:hypothetical protein
MIERAGDTDPENPARRAGHSRREDKLRGQLTHLSHELKLP